MKNIVCSFLLCALAFFASGQVTVNKTDAKGLKQGKWVSKYPDGKLKYEGYFENDKPAGEWKRFHENGKTKAIMTYRPHSDRVSAILFDDEGKKYARGVFEGTQRDSTWNFYNGDKVVLIENYANGKKSGKSTGFDADGKILWEKEMKNDSLNGTAIEYYPGGTKRNEILYASGKKSGPATFFDEQGLKTTDGYFKDDLSDGNWKVYDSNGKLKYQIQYQKGEILNGSSLDSLQRNEFKQYDKAKGKIPEPKVP
jgi:antitoxin component YwqK of YwqJK toxin-antitoxin module